MMLQLLEVKVSDWPVWHAPSCREPQLVRRALERCDAVEHDEEHYDAQLCGAQEHGGKGYELCDALELCARAKHQREPSGGRRHSCAGFVPDESNSDCCQSRQHFDDRDDSSFDRRQDDLWRYSISCRQVSLHSQRLQSSDYCRLNLAERQDESSPD